MERSPLLTSADTAASVNGNACVAVSDDAASSAPSHKNQLGTINGCYVPCLLNIMGIVLFLRLSWAVGQAGIWTSLGILTIAETQVSYTSTMHPSFYPLYVPHHMLTMYLSVTCMPYCYPGPHHGT